MARRTSRRRRGLAADVEPSVAAVAHVAGAHAMDAAEALPSSAPGVPPPAGASSLATAPAWALSAITNRLSFLDRLALAATCRRLCRLVGDATGFTVARALLGAELRSAPDWNSGGYGRGVERPPGGGGKSASPPVKEWVLEDYVTSRAGVVAQGRAALAAVGGACPLMAPATRAKIRSQLLSVVTRAERRSKRQLHDLDSTWEWLSTMSVPVRPVLSTSDACRLFHIPKNSCREAAEQQSEECVSLVEALVYSDHLDLSTVLRLAFRTHVYGESPQIGYQSERLVAGPAEVAATGLVLVVAEQRDAAVCAPTSVGGSSGGPSISAASTESGGDAGKRACSPCQGAAQVGVAAAIAPASIASSANGRETLDPSSPTHHLCWLDLPRELLELVLSWTYLDDRARFGATCRRARALVGDSVALDAAAALLGATRVGLAPLSAAANTSPAAVVERRRRAAAVWPADAMYSILGYPMTRAGVVAQGKATLHVVRLIARYFPRSERAPLLAQLLLTVAWAEGVDAVELDRSSVLEYNWHRHWMVRRSGQGCWLSIVMQVLTQVGLLGGPSGGATDGADPWAGEPPGWASGIHRRECLARVLRRMFQTSMDRAAKGAHRDPADRGAAHRNARLGMVLQAALTADADGSLPSWSVC